MGSNLGYEFDQKKVRRLMAEKGWGVRDFAEECDMDHSQMSMLLRRGRCQMATLNVLADVLGVPNRAILPEEEKDYGEIKVMLDEGAKMPTRAHDDDAGLDLYSPIDFVIPGRSEWYECFKEVNTGVHIQIPKGYVGDVKSKSGLMMNNHVTTDGTVDAGYTGAIRVKLFNHGLADVHIQKGQKIAQVVIKKIITPKPVLADSLEATDRGDNGFGSSGKF